MAKLPWTPWHEVVTLRDDLRSGELSLSLFAADLYEVAMRRGTRPVYEDPAEFFALTYPTHNLRELARGVMERLAGRSDQAVRQLQLTYGGGKTHALLTLLHLAQGGDALPDLPAVREFVGHIGFRPEAATVAVLPFDKLDVEKGMDVVGAGGARRWLRQPWSVLAYQIAGDDGLRLLHADSLPEERASAPAENLLGELLALPMTRGQGTLVLADEVLMYAREKVGNQPEWRGTLLNFFQYLTGAATRVDRCAVVASLLATDPRKSDALGKELAHELYEVFGRQREEAVEPVVKEDVAEVLRRRFFTSASIANPDAFKPHVVAGLKGLFDADETSRRSGAAAQERFQRSYPFHPDLTEVLYSKWTALESFQRTRGVLRTFALALRDAERWDSSPFVGPAAFLGPPASVELSPAARELATVAASEEYEGKRQEWAAIVRGELDKAREIQEDYRGLRQRELEQAVLATFLHSQPIGHKASTRDLVLLTAPGRPDRIELEEGLRRWADVSWFLDEAAVDTAPAGEDGRPGLPREWRLGTRPNLKQMHHEASEHLDASFVEAKVLEAITSTRSLTSGASAAGARPHALPASPKDVDDDGELHFVVLGPKAESEPGKPNPEATRYIRETTGPDRPRTYQNAIVVAVPSRDGLAALRSTVRRYLGWEQVREQLKGQALDPVREQMLASYIRAARDEIQPATRNAYNLVVTLDASGDVQAYRLGGGDQGSLFLAVKADARVRIQDTAVSADALLPGGPYDLWRSGETSRRLADLVGAFAQFPHLPKMLERKAVVDTLLAGCAQGSLVLSLRRPDGSRRTWWRNEADDVARKDPGLEVLLPERAELATLDPAVLEPGVLPGLWTDGTTTFAATCSYFGGGHTVMVPRDAYEEPMTVPRAPAGVVKSAVEEAVQRGILWLRSGPASLWREPVPPGVLSDAARLAGPPAPVAPAALLPESAAEAWQDGVTNGLSLLTVLSARRGETLPWEALRDAVDGALRAHYLERSGGPWPCTLPAAQQLELRLPSGTSPAPGPGVSAPPPGLRVAVAELETHELQDLAERFAEIIKAAAGLPLRLEVRIELGGESRPPFEVEEKVNQVLEEIKAGWRLY